MTADQVLAALWRRRKLVLMVAAAVFVVGVGVVANMSKVYQATSVVRVDVQRPVNELVHRSVGNGMEHSLLTVRQELLSRPVLQRVIEELDLYSKLRAEKGVEAAVQAMRQDLEVKLEGDAAFELTYSAKDPVTAAKVANRVPQIYGEEAVKSRQTQAARATDLFSTEIERLKETLSGWEEKIAEFKVQHMGELPEQLDSNMRTLDRLTTELKTKSEELRQMELRRSDMVRGRSPGDTEGGRLSSAEAALAEQLVSARANWTADHPEVKRLESEIAAMKSRREESERGNSVERQERSRAGMLVAASQRDMGSLEKQIELYQKRIEETPRWAHALGVLERDYEIAKNKYQSMISRRVEAELAQELEIQSASQMFHIISPAVAPLTAAKPDRLTALMIAFLISLALGAMSGVIADTRDPSIRTTHEIKGRLPIPVLAVVPMMDGRTERRMLIAGAPTTATRTTAPVATTTPMPDRDKIG